MPRFVIGIGSQRAGSTLLHRILDAGTDIYMHPMKELHYFDTLYNIRAPEVLKKFSANQLEREVAKICESSQFGFINKRYKNYLRTAMFGALKEVKNIQYQDLYRPCLVGNSLLGEITPEYMLLPPAGVKKMAEVVGKDATILLLARNPTERLISAFKLYKFGVGDSEMKDFESELMKMVEEGGSWMAQQDAFNDYETSLTNFQKEFERVVFLKYDDLFENPSKVIELLKSQAEIEVKEDAYKELLSGKVNNLAETAPVSKHARAIIAERYAENNLYLTEKFGLSCNH